VWSAVVFWVAVVGFCYMASHSNGEDNSPVLLLPLVAMAGTAAIEAVRSYRSAHYLACSFLVVAVIGTVVLFLGILDAARITWEKRHPPRQ